jgi:hypothetical protein
MALSSQEKFEGESRVKFEHTQVTDIKKRDTTTLKAREKANNEAISFITRYFRIDVQERTRKKEKYRVTVEIINES